MYYEDNYMSFWKWLGFFCLPLIPVVGSIIQLVLIFKWAFGSKSDPTLKNFCRLILVFYLLIIISCTLTITINGASVIDWLQSILDQLKETIQGLE